MASALLVGWLPGVGMAEAGSQSQPWFSEGAGNQLGWLLAQARSANSPEQKKQALMLASALLESEPEQCADDTVAATRQSISDELLELLLSADASSADQRQALAVWQQRREQQLAEALGDRCLPPTPPLADLLAHQVADTAVVHIILLPKRIELLLSYEGAISRYSQLVPKAIVVATARRYQRALQRNQPRAERYGQRLSTWLLQPLWPELQKLVDKGSLSLLQLHVDQQLLSLPWAALPTPTSSAVADRDVSDVRSSSKPFGFTMPLAVASGRASLVGGLAEQKVEPAPRVLAAMLNDPELLSDAGFSPLPAAGTELAEIQRLLPTRRLENQKLTRRGISRVLGGRDYSVLHLATHGELGSVDNSFVLLADGPLPLSALGDLVNERRYSEQPLRLVTLSACETALATRGSESKEGKQSDLGSDRLGLAGVALQSGARSALASLWAVDDAATAALMGLFYSELKQARSVAEALQLARQKMPGLGYRQARDWAGFQVFGSGR